MPFTMQAIRIAPDHITLDACTNNLFLNQTVCTEAVQSGNKAAGN